MSRKHLYAVSIAALFLILPACETFPTEDDPDDYPYQEQDRYGDYPDDDYTVTLYEHQGFRGRQESYILEDGNRHQIIAFVGWGLNDRISSLRCGPGVGVALFRDRDFRGPVAIYGNTTDMVDRDINDWASSAIVFDRDMGGPLGVWLGQGGGNRDILDTSGFHNPVWFYPMHESMNARDTDISLLRDFNDQAEWVILGPIDSRDWRRSTYYDRRSGSRYSSGRSRSGGVNLEVVIYEHERYRGRSVLLPDRSRDMIFDLSNHNMNRTASSMVMREVGGRRYY